VVAGAEWISAARGIDIYPDPGQPADLVGDKVNSPGFNWVAWISTAAMILLTVVVAYTSLHDLFHW